MSVVTRTNLATNPTAATTTGYAAVAGTGGTAALTNQTSAGYSGNNFNRVAWTVATTAISGGFTYTQTGLAASTFYYQAFWVRSSKAQTVALSVAYRDAALATVNTVTGPAVVLAANVWTLVTAPGSSGAAVTSAVCTVAATTGGVLWANTDTFDGDAAMIEAPPIQRTNLFSNPSFETASGTVNVRTNLATNPNFELDAASWTVESGAVFTRDTVSPIAGTASGKLVGLNAGSDVYATATASAGDVWTFSLDYKAPIAPGGVQKLRLVEIGGLGAVWETILPTVQAASARFSVTSQALSAGVTSLALVVAHSTNAQPVWFDNVLIEKSATAGTYFDGATAAVGDFTYAWSGPVNASTSYQIAPVVVGVGAWWGAADWAGYQSSARTPLGGTKNFRLLAKKAQTILWGTTAPQTAVSAGDVFTISYSVNPTVAQSFRAKASFDGGGANADGLFVSCLANTWTRISHTFTVPAGATLMTVYFNSEDLSTVGATYDFDQFLIEKTGTLQAYFDGTTADVGTVNYAWTGGANASTSVQTTAMGPYFDGSFVNANSVMYAWTGAANASTSTAKTYTPVIALVAKTDAPCPRVEVTITDLTPTDNVVTVWRTADGKRQAVRGARKRDIVGSDFVTDYEVPLGRLVSYEVEVVSGLNAQVAASPQTTTVSSATWWIQDPLVPSGAIAVMLNRSDPTKPFLSAAAVKNLEYAADITLIPVQGSPDPVALIGQRMAAAGIGMDMFTRTIQTTTDLRKLLQQTALLLVRPTGDHNDGVPGLAYLAVGKPAEQPWTVTSGTNITHWQITGDLVAAPTMNVLVPLWTYGDVKALWGTYQQAQTALSGKTYLDVLKSPAGT